MTPRELFGPQITRTSDSKPVLKNEAVPDVIKDITPNSLTGINNQYQRTLIRNSLDSGSGQISYHFN